MADGGWRMAYAVCHLPSAICHPFAAVK